MTANRLLTSRKRLRTHAAAAYPSTLREQRVRSRWRGDLSGEAPLQFAAPVRMLGVGAGRRLGATSSAILRKSPIILRFHT